MWDWLKAAQTIHALLAAAAAMGFFLFCIRTRFWFPGYVRYLGGFALALGLACLALMPADAPLNRGEWAWLKKALLALVFPGIVYFFFVFHGGQRAAYERTRQRNLVLCPYCRNARVDAGSPCPNCGQTVT